MSRRVGRRIGRTVLPPVVLGVLLVGIWYLVSYGLLSAERRFLLHPPHEVLANGFGDRETLATMLRALWSSTRVALAGLAISIVVGVAMAVVMSLSKLTERAAFPYLVTLQAVPVLAIVPLIQFWFGSGQTSRIVVCVLVSLFPIIVTSLFGLQSAEAELHDLFTLHRAGRATRLWKLTLPAALPAIFAGMRIAAGTSVIGAIVGDFFFGRGDAGIGQLMRRYVNLLQGEELLASLILASALGVAIFWLFGWLQHQVVGHWYDGTDDPYHRSASR